MEYFLHSFLFLTLCLSFTKETSSHTALDGRASKYHGCKVFTVRISSDKDIRVLRNMEKKYLGGVQVWADNFGKGDLVTFHVKTNYVTRAENMLKRHSVVFKVHKVDMEQTIRRETKKLRDVRYEEFGYNYAKHNPFTAMYNLLVGLTNKYRRISRLEVAGCTVEKRPILAVHISKNRWKRKPAILIECGVHAREWSGFEVCIYFISELLKQKTKKVKKLTSMYDFVILPALNPDGYVYTWTKDRMWRKNRSCNLPGGECVGQCVGVDVNRNFDVNFCTDKKSSNNPCSETYCGKFPFSERESQVVKKYIAKLRNRLLAFFCIHAYMSVWSFPWAKTKELPRNYRELERVANVAVATMKKMNNTIYTTGNTANVIYTVDGSSMDYSYDVGRAKYAYAVELREGKKSRTGFIMNEDEIIPLCQEFSAALVNSILAMRPGRD